LASRAAGRGAFSLTCDRAPPPIAAGEVMNPLFVARF